MNAVGIISTQPQPSHRPTLTREILIGLAAGVTATFVAGRVDKVIKKLVSQKQKIRERKIRRGSPHEIAGSVIARKTLHRIPSAREDRIARSIFSTTYGLVWGAIHTAVRNRHPQVRNISSIPVVAGTFFLLCDGAIAPLLKLSPGIPRIPWAFNVKEYGNHLVWTAVSELFHRMSERETRSEGSLV